jgi:septum formation protein
MRFRVEVPDLPEAAIAGESPEDHVRRLAGAKAEWGRRRDPDALVLAADTAVVLDSSAGPELLGKPAGREEARRMLRRLSGREHRVLTGLALRGPGGASAEDVRSTRVRFARLDEATIEWYVRTGEPLDKAGAYGLQGCAAVLIEEIRGSWSNVVGLPLDALPALFARAGYDLLGALAAP